jgi:hypothetical protein
MMVHAIDLRFLRVLGFALLVAGCARTAAMPPAPAPPSVTVSFPVEREVTVYADFTA